MRETKSEEYLKAYKEYLIRKINQNKIDWTHPVTILELLTFAGFLIYIIYLYLK